MSNNSVTRLTQNVGYPVNKSGSDTDNKINDYLLSLHIRYNAIYCGEVMKDNNWICDKWSITFIRAGIKKSINFDYFTGTGHRVENRIMAVVNPVFPHATGLIYSCIMSGDSCNMSFRDWCNNYGYDSDSIKALETYRACQEEYNKLQGLFSNKEIETLQELLQDY